MELTVPTQPRTEGFLSRKSMPSIKTSDRISPTFVLCPELLLYVWNLLFVDEKEGFCSVGVSVCSGSLVGAGRGGGLPPAGLHRGSLLVHEVQREGQSPGVQAAQCPDARQLCSGGVNEASSSGEQRCWRHVQDPDLLPSLGSLHREL